MVGSAKLRQILATRYRPRLRRQLEPVWRGADWPALTQEATVLGLAPLFYDTLKHNNVVGVPPTALAHLQRNYMTVGLRNGMMMTALAGVLRRFNEAGIRAIVLKGAALVAGVYGNLAVRDMQDVDILLPPDRLDEGVRLLMGEGFERAGVDLFPAGSVLGWHAVLMEKVGQPTFLLELHGRLLQAGHYFARPPFDVLWERSLSLKIEGVGARVLAPDDQLLHVCGHALAHHQGLLASVGPDVAHIVARYQLELDWERLLVTARDYDWVVGLQRVLLPVVAAWEVGVPAGVCDQIERLEPRALERFLTYCQTRPGWQQIGVFVASSPRWHYLKTLLFPPPAYMSAVWGWQPTHPLPLAYLRRFWQLIAPSLPKN